MSYINTQYLKFFSVTGNILPTISDEWISIVIHIKHVTGKTPSSDTETEMGFVVTIYLPWLKKKTNVIFLDYCSKYILNTLNILW